LPQPQADRLAEFFISDTCKTLRTVVRTRIADDLAAVGNATAENAESFMRSGTVSQEAQERIGSISRLSIFLKVLDEVQQSLLTEKSLKVIPKITVDTD